MNKNMNTLPRMGGLALAVAACAVLSGCATSANPQDPFEKFNRASFAFNDTVDRTVLKPVATGYKNVTPGFIQTGVGNFFGNLSDAWSAVNNLLQGKGEAGMTDVTRVALNSTFGILGLLDIASDAGLQKHNEDFGQTLGHWGVPSGPFVMLPLFGPSTVRDTAALPADRWGDPWKRKDPHNWRNIGSGIRVVDQRASLLDASNLLEEAALDRYEFLRDGFLQRRQSQVYDGNVPRTLGEDADDAPTTNTQVVPEPVSPQPAAPAPAAGTPEKTQQ